MALSHGPVGIHLNQPPTQHHRRGMIPVVRALMRILIDIMRMRTMIIIIVMNINIIITIIIIIIIIIAIVLVW